jgi:hypothetical protein
MGYTRVRVGTDFYNETTTPTVKEDGTLVLASGQAFAPGTWEKTDVAGELPKMPRGAVGTNAKKPDRKNKARGFGSDNTG